jgi:hypothetical protein
MGALGELVAGDYQPGEDGRAWADLAQAERFEVIAAFYRALHAQTENDKKRIAEEAELIAGMETIEARRARMAEIRTARPAEFERLANAVRLAYARRVLA